MRKDTILYVAAIIWLLQACGSNDQEGKEAANTRTEKDSVITTALKPAVITDTVEFDTDDPAIWINPEDPAQSLIIGTDKETGGGLYVFNLQGKIVNKVTGLNRPNNVDIALGLNLEGKPTDVAVTTERKANRIRIYSIPGMKAVDGGGIEVFQGEANRDPMGIACYKRSPDGTIFVIVGRKSGPQEGYLWQYKLVAKNGKADLELVRKFGKYSGKKEIESIAVDNELGFVYYSDEQVGIRKYYADPEKGNEELALFGQGEFKEDNEGISIYRLDAATGYILVSNQADTSFNIYAREGTSQQPHQHTLLAKVPVSALESDGSEMTSVSLPGFEGGLFVAMSTDKTFHYYRWKDIAERAGLKVKAH